MRSARDPIDYVKKLLIDEKLLSADEVKAIEKEVRESVNESLLRAKAGKFPPDDWVVGDVFSDEKGRSVVQPFVRMPDIKKSYVNGKVLA